MSQITTLESVRTQSDGLAAVDAIHGATDGAASQEDIQAFLDLLNAGEPTEEEMLEQYEKNFQTLSYLFIKGVVDHVEEEIKKQQ